MYFEVVPEAGIVLLFRNVVEEDRPSIFAALIVVEGAARIETVCDPSSKFSTVVDDGVMTHEYGVVTVQVAVDPVTFATLYAVSV